MKQVLQHINSGELELATVPPPALRSGMVRVRTAASLVSAGTEKMLIDLAQKSLIGKAQARPDLVRQVVEKIKKEGVVNTYRNVRSKLERPMPLGYSAAGIVEEVAPDVSEFQLGDRVAIAGAGYASHAEVNVVPKNLVAKIPEDVAFEDAAYVTVASIALQGIRLARPELGDNVVVIGLGLIGLITSQLLKANGCRVLGIDLNPRKVELALELGIDEAIDSSRDDAVRAVERFTSGRGCDHTLITAATDSNAPIELAGEVTRRKGRVVAVGAVGMNIPRDAYYKKELEVLVSMSYGPGRYDPSYEEGGIDYPYDYVRWTEQRNMEAVLNLMSEGRLTVSSLTTHRFAFDHAMDAYQVIQSGDEEFVGVLLEYDVNKSHASVLRIEPREANVRKDRLGVAFVGAGNYATLHLLPHVTKDDRAHLTGLVTATGLNAQQKSERFGFEYCSTDFDSILDDDGTDAVFIATRHSTHADFAARALNAGKHVFVEKPMVVTEDQLSALRSTYEAAAERRPTALMVGLNRRFAPMITELKKVFSGGSPKQMTYRVNSGHVPTSSWLHEPDEGGGMLVGEMCHFVDLMQFVAEERPVSVYAQSMSLRRSDVADHDNLTIVIAFDGGSVGTLSYNTVGDKAASKERLEVFGEGSVATLDDFRRLEIMRDGRKSRTKSMNQDKGQEHQIEATLDRMLSSGSSPIPFDELVAGMQVIFAAKQSLAVGQAVGVERYHLEVGSPS